MKKLTLFSILSVLLCSATGYTGERGKRHFTTAASKANTRLQKAKSKAAKKEAAAARKVVLDKEGAEAVAALDAWQKRLQKKWQEKMAEEPAAWEIELMEKRKTAYTDEAYIARAKERSAEYEAAVAARKRQEEQLVAEVAAAAVAVPGSPKAPEEASQQTGRAFKEALREYDKGQALLVQNKNEENHATGPFWIMGIKSCFVGLTPQEESGCMQMREKLDELIVERGTIGTLIDKAKNTCTEELSYLVSLLSTQNEGEAQISARLAMDKIEAAWQCEREAHEAAQIAEEAADRKARKAAAAPQEAAKPPKAPQPPEDDK